MDSELPLDGKCTFRVGMRKQVFVEKPDEHFCHVVMKALSWAQYLPARALLQVEVSVLHRYKADWVALVAGTPFFRQRPVVSAI